MLYTVSTMARQRHKKRSTRRSRPEEDAKAWCEARGLYILFSGVGRERLWTVFRLHDGREIGTWSPITRQYVVGDADYGIRGTAGDWRKGLERIKALNRGRRN